MPDGEERETDIFIVFEIGDTGKRFALNVENKTIGRDFEDGQAESYKKMALHLMEKEEGLKYADFETVLIAPLAYRNHESYKAKCELFERFISHEEISHFIPEFRNCRT